MILLELSSEGGYDFPMMGYDFARPRPISICPYVFSCKMFVKSDFFVYSYLEHSSDEKKKELHFFLTL